MRRALDKAIMWTIVAGVVVLCVVQVLVVLPDELRYRCERKRP
jgi:hypothetical protein